ncbi:MAG: glutamate racemase [Atopobiaceae bacterium]|nr:glutamate racemase [Atopobiaceae bacterium]
MSARLTPHSFVGVFDSGVGGMSVLKHLVKRLPQEYFCYFGDSAFAPYGSKSKKEIVERSFFITQKLLDQGAKAIVIACNTATAAASEELRNAFPNVPIVGVEPALKPAVTEYPKGTVVVLATQATLSLEKYHGLIERLHPSAKVLSIPGEGLVELIESGKADSKQMHTLLSKLLGEYTGMVDAVVLGCTHYPFIKKQITSVLGKVAFFDGGVGVSKQLKRLLEQNNLLIPKHDFSTSNITSFADVMFDANGINLGCKNYTYATSCSNVLFFSSIDTPAEVAFYNEFFSQELL